MRAMKLLLVILLLQHVVISARSGLVTYVRSMTVEVDQHMEEGNEIRGGRGSRFEAMLGSDTYVRMRDSSAIVLDSEALDSTFLRLVEGSAVIDARKIDEDFPIRLLMGDFEFSIGHDGLYLFERDRVVVLEGEILVSDSEGNFRDTRLKEEWMLARQAPDSVFTALEIEDTAAVDRLPLVRWSRQRTNQLTPAPVFRRSRGTGRRFRF
jgi:hypothetical protein